MTAFVPKTLEELLPQINNEEKRLVAGCTDVMVGVKVGKLKFKHMIDLNEVKEIKKIFEKDNRVYIGANLPISDIIESKIIQSNFPILIQAISTIGSIQIRNRATLGGNIQNASPSGDSIVALTLYDATLVLNSLRGKRSILIKDFIKGVGKTDLKQDEFIEYIVIDKKYNNYGGFFEKVGLRNSMIISVASMGVLLLMEGDVIEDIKVACGAVAPKILEIVEAEEFLRGEKINREILDKACEIIKGIVTPIDDIRASAEYRREVCGNLILRLLEM